MVPISRNYYHDGTVVEVLLFVGGGGVQVYRVYVYIRTRAFHGSSIWQSVGSFKKCWQLGCGGVRRELGWGFARWAIPGGFQLVLDRSDSQLRHNTDKTPKISKIKKVVGSGSKLQGSFEINTGDDSRWFGVKILFTGGTRGHTLKSRGFISHCWQF